MTNKVAVYILSANPDKTRLAQTLFSDDLFDLKVVQIDVPDKFTYGDLSRSKAAEWYRFLWVLKDSKENKVSYTLIVKDTIVGNSDAATNAEIIDATIKAGGFHICYCAKWWDQCSLHTNQKSIANKTTMIAKTHGVSGTQALLISPTGRDILMSQTTMNNGHMFNLRQPLGDQLREDIIAGNIDCNVIVPSLFTFDITQARTAEDYKKLSECQLEEAQQSAVLEPARIQEANTKIIATSDTSNVSWVMWFLVAIFVLLFCYLCILGLRQILQRRKNIVEFEENSQEE